jgi:excisionase family DNA binding protein
VGTVSPINRQPASRRELLTPGEVAQLFRVDVHTVRRWAKEGRIDSIRTIGGQHRFFADEVRAYLNSEGRS